MDRDLWNGIEMNVAWKLIIVKLLRNKFRKKKSIKEREAHLFLATVSDILNQIIMKSR